MKRNSLVLLSLAAALLFTSHQIAAQDGRSVSAGSSKYVISAEAGAVNFVSGRVTVDRESGRSGYLLKGDKVKIGDRITASETGKAEILLNPGSYLRLGGNSGFEFIDTSLENLQVKLFRGSAMFEVITGNDFTFTVSTPNASFGVVKSGVYRVDVLGDGTGRLKVLKGKAFVGDDDDATLKKGRSATVDGENVAVAKFDRGEADDLEAWSKERAKELDKINDRLERQNLRNSLISGFHSNRWSFYDSFGLWIYDPFSLNYCFLPFGYGWSSPYGYNFGRDIWWFRLPRYIYVQPPRQGPVTGTVNTTAETGRNVDNTRTVPPFKRVDSENRGSRFPIGRGGGTSIDSFPTVVNPRTDTSPRTLPEPRQPTQPIKRRSTDREDN